MFKGKISKVVLSLLVLSILLTSVFAADFFSEGNKLSFEGERPFNNPFTYSYEYDDMRLAHSEHFNQAQANDRDKWIDAIAVGLVCNGYTMPIGAMIGIYNAFDGSHRNPGTLKIWTGEKRQIATSKITGESHVVNKWFNYKIVYIGEDGSTLLNKSGTVHER